MEKFKFEVELKEAVLIFEEGQPYVIAEGEKRRVRSPVPLRRDSIGDEGIACLISERDASGAAVVAVLYDDLPKEKEWLCISPLLMEEAVFFFLTRHLMERMVDGYGVVRRETCADFELDASSIIELRLPQTVVRKETGCYAEVAFMFQPVKHLKKRFERILRHSEAKRVILLIPLPHKCTSLLKTAMTAEVRQVLEDAVAKGLTVEFWTAVIQFHADGISLLAYEDITEMLTGSGTNGTELLARDML